MSSRPIPSRHEDRQPHLIGEASYLEAAPQAPPLNTLRPGQGRVEYHADASRHVNYSNFEGQDDAEIGTSRPFFMHQQDASPPTNSSGEHSDRRYSHMHYSLQEDTIQSQHNPQFRGAESSSIPVASFPSWSGRVTMPPLPFPPPFSMPPLPPGVSNALQAGDYWPTPDNMMLPPPPPGFRFHELFPAGDTPLHMTTAATHDTRAPGQRPLTSSSSAHHAKEVKSETAWPTPGDVPLPAVFPFPPPLLPPPPPLPWNVSLHDLERLLPPEMAQHAARLAQQLPPGVPPATASQVPPQRPLHTDSRVSTSDGDGDLPWLPRPADSTDSDAEVHRRRQSARATAHGQATSRSSHADPHEGWADNAASSTPWRSSSTSIAEQERLRMLADQARRRFSSQAAAPSSRSASCASSQGPKEQDPPQPRQRTTEERKQRTAEELRQRASYEVPGNSQGKILGRLPPDVQARLKEEREERINARRRAVGNFPSVATGRSQPLDTSRTAVHISSYGHAPPHHRTITSTAEAELVSRLNTVKTRGASSHSHFPERVAAQQPQAVTNRSDSRRAAVTPNRSATPHASASHRTPRGVTLKALKGDTPSLVETMRNGLPSERRRLHEYRQTLAAQQDAQRRTNSAVQTAAASPPRRTHNAAGTAEAASPSFIGFGATQYTPFVELARKDPRAAEYLRGIETLYHNLRSSYDEFQRHPEAFIKKSGPSAAAIHKAATADIHAAHTSSSATTLFPSPIRNASRLGDASLSTLVPSGFDHRHSAATAEPRVEHSRFAEQQAAPINPITPPRLPIHLSELTVDVQPSAETRKLREELDRLESHWQTLAAVRDPATDMSSSSPPSNNVPTKDSVSRAVREQFMDISSQASASSVKQQTAPDSSPSVFTYENVLGLVRERKQQLLVAST